MFGLIPEFMPIDLCVYTSLLIVSLYTCIIFPLFNLFLHFFDQLLLGR